ncbi:MAG TPA: hypothetical protein VKI01_01580 [Acidimicrobiia bacterium]|nr:hypothetical protein [Acidimicrobiia bacterium]
MAEAGVLVDVDGTLVENRLAAIRRLVGMGSLRPVSVLLDHLDDSPLATLSQ